MKKISGYFLKEFLRPLVFSFCALCVLVLVSELLEHLDKFIAGKAGPRLVVEYLLCLLPLRAMEILPVAVLLATLFSLGNLSRRQEITAAMSGGLHPWLCVRPLLLCGLALSLAGLILNDSLVPAATRRARALWKLEIRHFASLRQTRFDNLTVAGAGGVFYAVGSLDAGENRLENVLVEWTEGGVPRRQLQARRADWGPDGWVFREGIERRFGEDGLEIGDQTPFAETRADLKESPEDLIPKEPDAEEMSYKQYNRHLRRLRMLGVPTRRQEVDLHLKLAFPWANFIVLLLGIPFAFRKTGGKAKAVGLAMGVAFFYIGLMQVGRALGQKPWCSPLMGAWLANLVFLGAGGVLFFRMKKLS